MKKLVLIKMRYLVLALLALGATELFASQYSYESEKVFQIVEEPPQFVGGISAQAQHLRTNLTYPEEALEMGLQGTVFVSFVVEKDGSISNVEILRGVHSSLDNEAIRVVKNMPKWTPGKNNGIPVRTQSTMPVRFALLIEEEQQNLPDNIIIFQAFDSIPPQFVGGERALTSFFENNLRFPIGFYGRRPRFGTVLVSFVVEKDGSISNARVIHSITPYLDREALRVIRMMPRWIPAKVYGKPVRFYYVMPVGFRP